MKFRPIKKRGEFPYKDGDLFKNKSGSDRILKIENGEFKLFGKWSKANTYNSLQKKSSNSKEILLYMIANGYKLVSA